MSFLDIRPARRRSQPGLILLLGLLVASAQASPLRLSLEGVWGFSLDRADVGLAENWHNRVLGGHFRLPGSLPQRGVGDPVTVETRWTGGIVDRSWFTAPEMAPYRKPGNVKVPFWLQPETYYVGPAWFQREIKVPSAWRGKRCVLFIERAHWETRVWVDDRAVGTNNALGTPHEYDLGELTPGPHRLTIRVDNRLVVDVGHDSHSVSDHTQGNWNGLVGKLELRARDRVWIENLQVFPSNTGTVRITASVRTELAGPGSGQFVATIREKDNRKPLVSGCTAFQCSAASGLPWRETTVEVNLRLPNAPKLWSEFNPALYECEAQIVRDPLPPGIPATIVFGFREFSTRGTQFTINGTPAFLRGTLECSIFPRTGHPALDVEEWKRILRVARAHGLNHLRFHSHCPPEAAFVAADEMGFYYQVECSSWANASTTLGDGKPVDRWIYEEADRILKYYGNHPSFVLMPYGNEPGGPRHAQFLAKWVEHYKARDSRRLYTSGAGWPQIPENQFHVSPDPRIQAWGGGLKSRINARPPETMTDYRDYIQQRAVPVISHEIGQWCVYPNFDEMRKYRGYLKPRNFEIFRDLLTSHHLGHQARAFLYASGKLQTLCYKEDIESALRTPGMGGFQLLDLHDFPGQGTALVGVLDPFWEEKGYVKPEEFRRFCNSTVPLARLSKRVFTTDETLEARLEIAHFGPAPLQGATVHWELVTDRKIVQQGAIPAETIPVNNGTALGEVRINLNRVPAPAQAKLVVSLQGTGFKNDWDVWIYPASVETRTPDDVLWVDELSTDAVARLDAGGKVLLTIPPNRVKGDPKLGKVALGFSSIFWNTAWTRRQAPHTLGILCDAKHPALARFPTDNFSNWQWWYVVHNAGAMILDSLPPALQPTVQIIDDWFTARKLGLIFEAKVRRGKLLVCSADLRAGATNNPVARQMLHSLLRYMATPKFSPTVPLSVEQVQALAGETAVFNHPAIKAVKASSCEPAYEPEKACDANTETMWHTEWTSSKPGYPHQFQIEFKQPISLAGFSLLPRQDNNRNGWIKEYALETSLDGTTWNTLLAKAGFPADAHRKKVMFTRPVTAKFFRIIPLSSHNQTPYAAIAEIEFH